MKTQILISIEGQESNTEKNFYQGFSYEEEFILNFYPISITKKSNFHSLEKEILNWIDLVKQNTYVAATNNGTGVPEFDIFIMYDNDENNTQLKLMDEFSSGFKSKIEDNIQIIKVQKGFEIGVLGKLFDPTINKIHVLTERYEYKSKRIFKKTHNKKLYRKTLELTEIKTSIELETRMKNNKCEHHKIVKSINETKNTNN